MKNLKKMLLASLIFSGCFTVVRAQEKQTTEPNFFEIQKKANELYKNVKTEDEDGKELPEAGGYAQYKRWEWFWQQRVTPDGKFPNPMVLYNESARSKAEQMRHLKKDGAQTLSPTESKWKEVGPFGAAQGSGAGRVNRIHLNLDFPNNIWAGTAAGGAWLSTDKGVTWKPKTDGIPSMGVTDIATTVSDPNLVYIATGDGDGTGAGVQTPMSYSVGVLKSTDGGTTWETTGLNWQTSTQRKIHRLLISPTNPLILFAGTDGGIYRTVDGGTTWTQALNGNVNDMEFKPDDPTFIYASIGNSIYHSINEGVSWKALPAGISGSGKNGVERIALGVSVDDPEVVYALCSRGYGTDPAGRGGFAGFYSSTNSGANWQVKATTPNILGRALDGSDDYDYSQQGYYDLAIAVSPVNATTIYIGGINIWKSTNGGGTWTVSAHWTGAGGKPYVHADVHDLVTTEDNTSAVFAGTDGGVFQTKNNGNTWSDLSAGMGIMQFYRISSSPSSAYTIIGGAQDNGTNLMKNQTTWAQVYGGDGMLCLIDQTNPRNMYAASQNGSIGRSQDGGANFSGFAASSFVTGGTEAGAWITPYVLDPTVALGVYVGYRNVWKYAANKWSKISNFPISSVPNFLINLAIAPSSNSYLYASTDNVMFKTSTGGSSWEPVTLPTGSISSITVHPTSPRKIWITSTGFSGRSVFQSDDAGNSWTDISEGLPKIPVNSLVYQKNSPDRLYVGTDVGVYYRDNSTGQWIQYNEGLPNVIVASVEINYTASKLRAGTFGRGVWEVDLVNCNAPAVTVAVSGGKTSICDGDSVQLTANAGFVSYRWSTGATTQSIFVKQTGNYSVVGTDGSGCSGSSPVTVVTVAAKKIPVIKGDVADSSACEGKPITLDVGFGFTAYKLKWNTDKPSDTTRKLVVTKPGVYIVTATNSTGCVGTSAAYTVKAAPAPPVPTITAVQDTLIATPNSKYQWKIAGVDVPGATSQKFIPAKTEIGKKVAVMVFNTGGCGTLSNEETIGAVGVDEDQYANSLQIFPNPTINTVTLNVTMKSSNDVYLEITNTNGTKMESFQFPANGLSVNQTISVKEFPAGTYIFTVTAGEQKWMRKIIKE